MKQVLLLTDLPVLDELSMLFRNRGFDVEGHKMGTLDLLDISVEKYAVIVIGPDIQLSNEAMKLINEAKREYLEETSQKAFVTIVRSVKEIDELGVVYPFMDYVRCPFDVEQLFLIVRRLVERMQ